MPLDATRNPLVVPILGLLVEQPAHAYEIAARLRSRYPHLVVRRSSVATLLKSLTSAGLVMAGVPERVANRPARTTHQLSEDGIGFFRSRVREGLEESVPASAEFLTAVAYLGILPSDEAITVLRGRAERLRRETPAIPSGVTEIQMIEVRYWLRVLATEIAWLTETADRIADGDLEMIA